MSGRYVQRLGRLRDRLRDQELAAFVGFAQVDCRYLTGFTGESTAVCVTAEDCVLVTDPRFTLLAAEQVGVARVVISTDGRDDLLAEIVEEALGPERVGRGPVAIDSGQLSVRRWESLRPLLEKGGLDWRLVSGLVADCRRIKFDDELVSIRESAALCRKAFAYLEGMPVVGRPEREVALDLEVFLRRNGSEGVAFPPIVAGGPRGALPHAEPSGAVIEPGWLVVVDLGAMVDGYAADMTRTYASGRLTDDLIEAYERVKEAQRAAVSVVLHGLPCSQVDARARGLLATYGLGDFFVHSVGHGVGMEIHEDPTLSTRSEAVLQAGMVVTVEPGVYLPGRGGIRIEDTIIVGDGAPEVVTEWPRDLLTLS